MKNILIGITGSIAAYKMPEVVRGFQAGGMTIRIILTESAEAFVSSLVLETLTAQCIYQNKNHLDASSKITHIELAKWADAILIAPASANFIAKLAHGLCDDLLSTVCLATKAPIFIAPAMNCAMWEALPTQSNVALLKTRGLQILGPDTGKQACGDFGEGRMLSVEDMIMTINAFNPKPIWSNKKVIITAGPTREAIDPVRYISNHSTGHMGYALANQAQGRGAHVTLITGPTAIRPPFGVKTLYVTSSKEMEAIAIKESQYADLFIGTAAIVDYTPEIVANQKIKKNTEPFQLNLQATKDIIQEIATMPQRPKNVIGFAAETENLEKNALEKLHRKNLNGIVANLVGNHLGFGDVLHEAIFLTHNKQPIHFPKSTKQNLADDILNAIEPLL